MSATRPEPGETWLFSDESTFWVGQVVRIRNDEVWARWYPPGHPEMMRDGATWILKDWRVERIAAP